MKKITVFFTNLFVILFLFGCSNIIDKSNNFNGEYGNLTVSTSNRAVYSGEINSVDAFISGYGFENDIKGSIVSYSNGSGVISFTNIPVGTNRVVTIQALDSNGDKLSSTVLTAVVNIENGENSLDNVSWSTSVKGNIYKAALDANMDTSKSSVSSSLDAAVEKVQAKNIHVSVIDSTKIINNLNNLDFDSISYEKTTASVSLRCIGVNGKSFFISDPYSSVKVIDSNDFSTTVTGVLTGSWNVYLKDGSSYTKQGVVIVTEAGTSFVIGQNDEEPILPKFTGNTAITDRIIVHVPSSLSYSYIYAWKDTNNIYSSVWPGNSMTDSDSDGYYDYTIKNGDSFVTSSSVIFNNGTGGSAGNGQTADLSISSAGEYWYKGGYSGSSSSSDWTTENPISTDPSISLSYADGSTFNSSLNVTITANNCTTASYTIDGTNPYSSSTKISFTGTKSITLGGEANIGDEIVLKVYADNGSYYVSSSATYTKVIKSTKPTRLGAYYTSSETSFSIWSPDNSNVTVTVTPNGGSSSTYTCTSGFEVDGDYSDTSNIYGVKVSGDLHLAEYQFKIGGVAVRDPYGVMVKYENDDAKTNVIKENYTENSCSITSYAGSSVNIVLDMDKTEPDGGWATRPTLNNRSDAIVYEVHVGDFTSSSTWGGTSSYMGKYPGMIESGTSYSKTKTGLDHLKELGITHVQIMPMYDFATKYNSTIGEYYNWGYDPVNYNVPEDRYSTCPSDYVARVKEVKEMINTFHKNGIRVVMDVVYNHTFDKEMFKNISASYYTGTDLSGCGNSVNTGVDMVSRFIRDSLEYWADEYNIDGFRFDLLGIYHTAAVKSWGEYINNKFSDRNILMYGEPWNGYATDDESVKVRMSAVSGMSSGHIGVFNGKFRESIKGSSDSATKGYMFNTNYDGDSTPWNISVGLRGSGTNLGSDTEGYWTRYFTASPDQSINYITAHDNLCLYDKIVESGVTDSTYQKQIVRFGHGILLVSQGIPFIHCGDEFLRTKKVGANSAQAHNSYMWGQEMNMINWSAKETNISTFNYHKDLIALRKAHDGFRSSSNSNVGTVEVSGQVIKYNVKDSDNTTLLVVVNPGSDMSSPNGTEIFNTSGATSSSGLDSFSGTIKGKCQGTAITIFKE